MSRVGERKKKGERDFYAGWLKGGNEGGEKDWSFSQCQARQPLSQEPSCSLSLPSASLADTSGHPLPTRVAAGGSEGDVPGSAVGSTLCLFCLGCR